MGDIIRKIKKEEEKGEKKKEVGGKKKKEVPANVFHDPSVDEYIVFYHTSWQPGVPEHVYNKFKKSL